MIDKTDKKVKILVVDDDLNLLDLLVDTLTTIGYEAEGVPGGSEALGRLSESNYDLVISDIRMPGMDGIALLKKVRRYYPKLPVLFVTGVDSHDIIGRASPDGFLAKPFRISHIEDMIADTLADKSEKIARPIRKVMVVDDEDIFRDMLADSLRYNEFLPLAVASGEQALHELENGEVDAVITDIKMPGMDGIALLHKIKAIYPELPVILVTGFYEPGENGRDDLEGADGFLEKPFDIEAIVKILNRLGADTVCEDQ